MSKMKYNRKCVICGTEYSYCTHGCAKDIDKPVWMANYDTYNCKQICELFTGNTIGKFISDEEAKTKLANLDLSKKDSFKPVIKEWIEKMMVKNQEIQNNKQVEVSETIDDVKGETPKRYIGKKPFKNKNRNKSVEDRMVSLDND